MCLTTTNIEYFSVSLTAFYCVIFICWRYLLATVDTSIIATRSYYTQINDYYGLEKLNALVYYLSGGWQLIRFSIGAVIISALDMVIFMPSVLKISSSAIALIFPITPALADSIIPLSLILVFVISTEALAWQERYRARIYLDVLSTLKERFALLPE